MAADDDGNQEMDLDEFTIMIKDIFSGRHDVVRKKWLIFLILLV